ncbi:hypothetical protein J1N35_023120 [Gossypium stocksii]|uniref:Uncharacterized protein n=1 Tax=Gossypium stocksii TaxID=47602 RepID=A0A9D3VJN1_9ROSI|nr:hypothetical protein J1N35_023120 [Gossypium stocksii]
MNQLATSQSQPINSSPQMMTQLPPPIMLNRSYKPWQSQNPNQTLTLTRNSLLSIVITIRREKKVSFDKDSWKFKNKPLPMGSISTISFVPATSGSNTQGYKPSTLNELQNQNWLKARKFYGNKKKFNNSNNQFAPYAPQNTTSFIIRAKKSGGITSLVSPCPVTLAVLPTPIFSLSRAVLGDMAKEE